ncbi:hypothetical protein RIF29_07594 [Crotalaria pallida]|uniref:Uncharacterized protein n=1 Tax=Crotalaria pallida TaxID=3830 RepID=A0AAN9PAW6_CROPI
MRSHHHHHHTPSYVITNPTVGYIPRIPPSLVSKTLSLKSSRSSTFFFPSPHFPSLIPSNPPSQPVNQTTSTTTTATPLTTTIPQT